MPGSSHHPQRLMPLLPFSFPSHISNVHMSRDTRSHETKSCTSFFDSCILRNHANTDLLAMHRSFFFSRMNFLWMLFIVRMFHVHMFFIEAFLFDSHNSQQQSMAAYQSTSCDHKNLLFSACSSSISSHQRPGDEWTGMWNWNCTCT